MKRRSHRERFSWHSVRHYVRKHRREYTDAEKEAAIHWFLVEEVGALICQCGRYWDARHVDAYARQFEVTIERSGDAGLRVCPRCALYAQLLGVLETRTQGLQLRLF